MKDYYQILSVQRNASADDIKKAFRRLASQHHPDKGGDTQRFQEIQQAYAVLSDPQQRQEYDNPTRRVHVNMGGGPNFNFDDIFSMFGASFGQQARQQSARLSLWVTLQDIAQGGAKLISLQMGNTVSNVEIQMPVGLQDGDTIRYAGLAPNGQDLIITYRIKPDDTWQRNNRDIVCERSLSVWDLILGCEIKVTDLTDTELVLTVPAMTQPGSMLRLRGRGLPPPQLPGRASNAPWGDLLVKVMARLPESISQDLTETIRRERDQ